MVCAQTRIRNRWLAEPQHHYVQQWSALKLAYKTDGLQNLSITTYSTGNEIRRRKLKMMFEVLMFFRVKQLLEDQNLRRERGQGNVHFSQCSADHKRDWQPYPVDPYSATCDDDTYIQAVWRHCCIYTVIQQNGLGYSTYLQCRTNLAVRPWHNSSFALLLY